MTLPSVNLFHAQSNPCHNRPLTQVPANACLRREARPMTRRIVRQLVTVGFAAGVALATPAAQQSAAYDIVIRNGRVLDGMGNPWIVADVAIKDGRFVKIGRVTGTGQRELDARGRYVSPGWIDMMDQSGAVLRAQRPGGKQAPHGRDDGDRRRRRHAGRRGSRGRVLRRPREDRASASTSAATSARRRRGPPSSATPRARRPPKSS